jgi:hypothetical protein
MMLSDNYFYQLSHLPLLGQDYIDDGLTAKYRYPKDESGTIKTPRTIQAPIRIADSKFIQDLTQKLNTTVKIDYFCNKPYTLYDWHRDIVSTRIPRRCAINFLLNIVPGSMTLFREPISRLNYNIIECPYILHSPMLFNTQQEHCVINNGNQDRYIMSVTPFNISYHEALEFFKTYYIDSY